MCVGLQKYKHAEKQTDIQKTKKQKTNITSLLHSSSVSPGKVLFNSALSGTTIATTQL